MPRHQLLRHVAPIARRRTYARSTNSNAIRRQPPPPPAASPPPIRQSPPKQPTPRPPQPHPEPSSPPLHTRPIYNPNKPITPRIRTIRNIGLVISSFAAAGIGLFAVQLYPTLSSPCTDPTVALLSHQTDVAHVYDSTADHFDAQVAFQEWISLLNRRRKLLAGKCHGDVLEVSCGTGRNLGYFDILGGEAKVTSLTFVDVSGPMVEVCRRKWDALYGGMDKGRFRPGLSVRFLAASALGSLPLVDRGGKREKKYTTIIQTMGLCSTHEPVGLVVNMARHLDLEDPEARIYLLEHGRSYIPLWNRVLDNAAKKHAEIHGCWYNREIGDIVAEGARKSGMEVARERRYQWGTVWMYELKPMAGAARILEANDRRREADQETVTAGNRGWLSSITPWK